MINEIILVKLANDDQYIGTLIEEDAEGIRLDNPLRVEVMYTSKAARRPNVVILPWNELSKMSTVYFDKFHVLYYTIPKDDIVDFYKKQIDTNIEPEEDQEQIPMNSEVLTAMIERITSNTTIN